MDLKVMTAPTSRQLRHAMALTKPEIIGSQARSIVDLLAAETIDLQPDGQLALEISHGTIGQRLSIGRATVARHLAKLIELRVVRWFNPPSGRAGQQARWLRLEGRFERWEPGIWRIDRSKALLLLSDAGCDRLYSRSLRQISDPPYGWITADGDPPEMLEVRRLRGDVVAHSMGWITEGTVVAHSKGGSLRPLVLGPRPLSGRSNDLPPANDQEEERESTVEIAAPAAQTVLDAIAMVMGKPPFDSAADNPRERVLRACDNLLDGRPVAGKIRRRRMAEFPRGYRGLIDFVVAEALAAGDAEQKAIADAAERRRQREEREAAEQARVPGQRFDRAALGSAVAAWAPPAGQNGDVDHDQAEAL